MATLHLTVIGSEPVSEGRFGCDYAWNDDFTAYRCMPHRWRPGSDSSYLAWQAGDLDNEWEEERTVVKASPVVVPVVTFDEEDDLPF